MRLVVMSDLHIEFQAMQLPDPDSYDVAILAGDIHTQARSAAWVARHFSEPTILVAGNHDYYKCSVDRALQRLHVPSGEHVHFLERQARVIGNVGCTSWTDFAGTGNQSRAMLDARSVVNDYRHIRPSEPTYVRNTSAEIASRHNETPHECGWK